MEKSKSMGKTGEEINTIAQGQGKKIEYDFTFFYQIKF